MAPAPQLVTASADASDEPLESSESTPPQANGDDDNVGGGTLSSFTLIIICVVAGILVYFCCFPDRLFVRQFCASFSMSNLFGYPDDRPNNSFRASSNRPYAIAVDVAVDAPERSAHHTATQVAEGEEVWRRVRVEDVCAGLAHDECTCCICLDSLVSERAIVALPCNHVLHEDCASSWRARSTLCPVCRTAAVS